MRFKAPWSHLDLPGLALCAAFAGLPMGSPRRHCDAVAGHPVNGGTIEEGSSLAERTL